MILNKAIIKSQSVISVFQQQYERERVPPPLTHLFFSPPELSYNGEANHSRGALWLVLA